MNADTTNVDDGEQENPWTRAAQSPEPRYARFTTAHNEIEETPVRETTFLDGGYFCCNRRNVRKTLKLWLCLDVIVGLGACLGVWWWNLELRTTVALLSTATVFLSRSILSGCGISTDLVCQRSTLLWSSYLSWLMVANMGVQVAWYWDFIQDEGYLYLLFPATVALVEIYRFLLLRHHFRYLLQRDRLELERPARNPATRPWWWTSNSQSPLEEPFLNSNGLEWSMETNNTSFYTTRESNEPSWWDSVFFWKSASADEADVRDEGSVNFASVQEEWASRAEEDPFWWSRDGDEENGRRKETSDASEPPSWIHTTSSSATSPSKSTSSDD